MPPVIDPTRESFQALSRDTPKGVPVVMLNLLRFREDAAYPEGSGHAACTGAEAYRRYGEHVAGAVAAAGAEVSFQGRPVAYPVAPSGEHWDEVLVVRYPTIEAFFEMVMAPEYQRHAVHRTAALVEARLICMVDEAWFGAPGGGEETA